ncbi:Phosphatidylinositol N-acetylglucosaminyltransferase subunit P [Operophtera brumata]|uniref:Phosphatidylinositol N-acetylglucosaminyltransferase subunit P n=1 Tax=Operophtera brumata TaxID=104452 RepID=A0A0L7KKI2_OPEBR|nr:Phosphatidylinositol N-acetylglucosaminyltransferase subunit P [Operophtera brumata]
MPEHTPAPTPARSLYGFFMYLFSKTILGIYCIWAFTPDYYLHMFNFYYYPQKYWSTAIPIQCLVALTMVVFFICPSSNMILTPNIDSINTIVDPLSNFGMENVKKRKSLVVKKCVCMDVSKCNINHYNEMPDCEEGTVPLLHDLDIRFVCRKLYYKKNA